MIHKSKCVVVLTPGFPEDENDTTCLPAFQQFALSLKKQYPSIEIIVLSFQYPFECKEYEWYGIKVMAIGGSNKEGAKRFMTWAKAYRQLQKIRNQKIIIGLLSLWLTECSLVAKYFAKLNGLKHYMWLIGQDAKLSNQYIKRIQPKGKYIIAMSDFLKEEYQKNHHEVPFMVAENGINEYAFPKLNTEQRSIDILGVGSLIQLKNYELFIEIIAELKVMYPRITALIAGIGEEEQHLKALVETLNLQSNITFAGLVSHTKVFDLMNDSRIFLHTSHYEGNSTVLMEALYSGCYTYSTCSLSNRLTENLSVLKTKADFVKEISMQLEKNELNSNRITFNSMDQTATKIMNLFVE
jgi:glycosyltransferase involved in cell wall biosynthesis